MKPKTPKTPKLVHLPQGALIFGDCTSADVHKLIADFTGSASPFSLIIADPPYGNIVRAKWDRASSSEEHASWMLGWSEDFARLSLPASAMYVWGGIGKPGFRPYFDYLSHVESLTPWKLANYITWSKRRGYGVQHNYLFTREELAYFVLGDIKRPRSFTVPYLEAKRGYAGYNAAYPAKSEHLRRTNVWTDVTEILRGKTHVSEKPVKLSTIMVETHTRKGDWVFEPFAGSASGCIAARGLERRFVGVESDPEEFDKALGRLRS